MRRIYVTITKRVPKARRSHPGEWCGNLAVLDWDSQKVLSQHWIEFTTGPRIGRMSWCRGLAVYKGHLCVAVSPGTIQYRNLDTLAVESELCIPKVDDVHDLRAHDGKLWVANTFYNELVIVRDHEVVERRTVLTPDVNRFVFTWRHGAPEIDKIHFNTITWGGRGRELHLYNSAFMIYDATNHQPVWLGRPLAGPHDLCFIAPGKLLVNSSRESKTYLLDLGANSYKEVFFAEKQRAMKSTKLAQAGWTRGLAVHKKSMFVGISPSTVAEVDYASGELIKQLAFSEDPREAPYSVLLDPRDWK